MSEHSDVFEITDYTTASDWERFISDFEEVIRRWNLTHKQSKCDESPDCSEQVEQYSQIKFAKVPFSVLNYNCSSKEDLKSEQNDDVECKALSDMMNMENDYPSRAHCICRYYGFEQFIVLCPVNDNDSIFTEDKAKLVLSGLAIAVGNTSCTVPVFLQLHRRERKFFQGIIVTPTSLTDLQMVHFRDIPDGFGFLSELLKLFKGKLNCPLDYCPEIDVSARLTHVLRKWPDISMDNEDINQSKINFSDLHQIKFECNNECLHELQLSTTWPSMSEETVTDSESHSDLNPLLAPQWTCRLICRDAASSTLVDTLFNFANLKNMWSDSDTLLGKIISSCEEQATELEVKQALDKLANPLSLSLPTFVPKLKLGQSQNLSKEAIAYIFSKEKLEKAVSGVFSDFRSFKSSPFNKVVWKIAMVLSQVYISYRDVALIAYIWKDLVNELRKYWESAEVIPGFEDVKVPNLNTCLLHQKLELLVCCIQQKKKRESNQAATNIQSGIDDDDDEFFDCVEDVNVEGRLEKHPTLFLLEKNEPLYVPVTQEPTPMTEDMLQEQAHVYSQLGTTAEGSLLRAKIQGANLLSDMEAFKAANPGAILEDFVRWHSPKDYIETEGSTKGQLSSRMQHSGNIWRELWDTARPKSAMKQKRLFDYTKEAEKFLHYLGSFNLRSLVDNLIPILIHSSTAQLLSLREELELSEDDLPIDLSEISHNSANSNFDHCLKLIQVIERKLLFILSLKKKMEFAHNLEFDADDRPFSWNSVKSFVLDLICEPEVKIPGNGSDYLGALIKRLFSESNVSYFEESSVGDRDYLQMKQREVRLPPPMAKEFILRVTIPYPAVYSKELPQRMYCLISANEFKLATSLTEDTTALLFIAFLKEKCVIRVTAEFCEKSNLVNEIAV